MLAYINGECDSIQGFKIPANLVAHRQAKLQPLQPEKGLQPTLPSQSTGPTVGTSQTSAPLNPLPQSHSNPPTFEPKKTPVRPSYEINSRTGLVKTLNDRSTPSRVLEGRKLAQGRYTSSATTITNTDPPTIVSDPTRRSSDILP